MIEMETRRQKIAKIIADNVHHSAQLNATVIHGAIDEIEKLIDEELSRLQEREKELVEALRELYKQQPTMLTLIPDAALDFLDLPKKATLLKVESVLSKFEAPNQS